jgi:hypothetical protein
MTDGNNDCLVADMPQWHIHQIKVQSLNKIFRVNSNIFAALNNNIIQNNRRFIA